MMDSRIATSLSKETASLFRVSLYSLKLESTESPEFIDITDEIYRFTAQAGIRSGFVLVFSKHTTAAIKINENEPLLLKDMKQFLEKLSPQNGFYNHNDFTARTVNMNEDECPNGHAHCQHLALSTSEMIPVTNGELQMGQYQRVFFVELDRPRPREVLIQVSGC